MASVRFLNPFETVQVNVYDIKTKRIIFTGSQRDASIFMGVTPNNMVRYIKSKVRVKKKYAVRFVSDKR